RWIAHDRAAIAIRRVARGLARYRAGGERPRIRGVGVLDVRVEQRLGRAATFERPAHHHDRIADAQLRRAPGMHRADRAECAAQELDERVGIVGDESRRDRVPARGQPRRHARLRVPTSTVTGTSEVRNTRWYQIGNLSHTITWTGTNRTTSTMPVAITAARR